MHSSALTRLHLAAGARLGPGPAHEPLTFGSVPEEYRAGLAQAALFDATSRGLLLASGKDAVPFLHRILASDVRGLQAAHTQRSLLLNGKGKLQFEFELEREDGLLRLSTPPGQAAPLCAALDRYLFNDDVKLEDASATHAPLELCGPRTREVVRAALGGLPELELGSTARLAYLGTPVRVAALEVAGSSGLRLDGGPELAPLLWQALVLAGARPAGRVAYDSLRVEAGAALFGVDLDENIYPQEARLERAFSLDKGCYIGQEVVAKIDTYGGLNKRLVALSVAQDEPLPRGAKLWRFDEDEWRELGLVTSWAYSFALDTGLALGYVKRRHQKEGTVFCALPPGVEATPAVCASAPQLTVVRLPVRSGSLPPTGEFE